MKETEEFYEKYWQRRINGSGSNLSGVAKAQSNIILKLILPEELSGKVLDVGCGDGTTLHMLRKHFIFDPYGVDISKSAVNLAIHKGIIAKVADATGGLPFMNESLDFIICAEVLEHVLYLERTLEEIKRVAKEDACIIFSVPNMGFFKYRFKLLIGDSPFEQGRYSSSEHLHFWTQSSIKHFLEANQFKIIRISGRNDGILRLIPCISLFSDTLFKKAKVNTK